MDIFSTVLLFLIVIFVLVLVHEWGHFFVAKRTGMRVDEFGIGFPPRLFGFRRGETEYTLNALPIGGFVRIYGEDPTAVEADGARAFGARPYWAQALVLIAGVAMNILFAWLLFVGVYLLGVPTPIEESEASPSARLVITDVVSDGPLAGELPPGVVVTELRTDAAALTSPTPSSFQEFVATHATEQITIAYLAGADSEEVTVEPQTDIIPGAPEQPAVGVRLSLIDTIPHGPISAFTQGTERTVYTLGAIVTGLWGLLSSSVAGEADLSQVAGPVGIAGLVSDAAAFGLTAFLTFVAVISLNLAIINLLPVPALDGGRLVFVAIEAVRGQALDPVWASRINLIGFALLMLLMLVITYNDIVRLF